MSTNTTARTSFFDDENPQILFEFQPPNKTHQKDLNFPPILSSILSFHVRHNSNVQQGLFVLYGSTLAFYQNNLSPIPQSVLNLTHSRLEVLPSITKEKLGSGFALTHNGNKISFYSKDEKAIESWINTLKSICVLTNFHDEYKALKMIGKGSFAKVYLVESKSSGKTFAVKAFTKEAVVATGQNAKAAMKNEIEIMRSLDNEKVIKLYEVFETEKSIYLTMELVQGRSLQEMLKKASFKDNDARIRNVISSLLEGLAYLASKGIMHRDLKPDNILIDKGDKLKIVDFGLATFIDVDYIFKKCGTPGYIAPEVFKYDPKNPNSAYDFRSDSFSAGCILFYMIFGVPMFDGANASEILKTNRQFTADFRGLILLKQELKNSSSKISKDSLDLLLKLLEFNKDQRIYAADALRHPYLFSVMQEKLAGSYNFYESGGFSPTIFDKKTSLQKNIAFCTTPRYKEKDSFFLDLGRPEMTGRLESVANGSVDNSLLIFRADSFNGASPKSSSPFARGLTQSSSFKIHANGVSGNPTVRKSAMVRNLFNQDGVEEGKENNLIRKNLQEVKHDRRYSEFLTTKMTEGQRDWTYGDYSTDEEMEDISQENPQMQKNIEKLKYGNQYKNPSKFTQPYPLTPKLFGSNFDKTKYEKGF